MASLSIGHAVRCLLYVLFVTNSTGHDIMTLLDWHEKCPLMGQETFHLIVATRLFPHVGQFYHGLHNGIHVFLFFW